MAGEAFFVRSRGEVSGPFDLAGLQRLLRLGMLSRVHEVSEDKQTWEPASRVPGLFPEAGAAEANVGTSGGAGESYRGMGVASMVLGICGLVIPFVGLICALLAVIFGPAALRGNKRLGTREGSGMATAGLVMGIISVSLYTLPFLLS